MPLSFGPTRTPLAAALLLAGGVSLPALAIPVTIMPIGNSQTHGFIENGQTEPYYGWRVPFQGALTGFGVDATLVGSQNVTGGVSDGTNAQNTNHEGHSSWHIGGIYNKSETHNASGNDTNRPSGSQNIDSDTWRWPETPGSIPNNFDGFRGLLDELPDIFDDSIGGTDPSTVDIFMLSIGINDIKDNEDRLGAPDRLAAVVAAIVAANPTAKLFVSTLNPVESTFSTSNGGDATQINGAIDSFNAEIASDIAALANPNVMLLDPNAFLDSFIATNGESATFTDGLHFTEDAYAALGDFYAGEVANFLGVPEPGTAMLLMAGGLLAMRRRRA